MDSRCELRGGLTQNFIFEVCFEGLGIWDICLLFPGILDISLFTSKVIGYCD